MLTCHCTEGAGDPLAAAENDASVPGTTPAFSGWLVTVGAAGYQTTARDIPAALLRDANDDVGVVDAGCHTGSTAERAEVHDC